MAAPSLPSTKKKNGTSGQKLRKSWIQSFLVLVSLILLLKMYTNADLKISLYVCVRIITPQAFTFLFPRSLKLCSREAYKFLKK